MANLEIMARDGTGINGLVITMKSAAKNKVDDDQLQASTER